MAFNKSSSTSFFLRLKIYDKYKSGRKKANEDVIIKVKTLNVEYLNIKDNKYKKFIPIINNIFKEI